MVLLFLQGLGECGKCVFVPAQFDTGNTFLVRCLGIIRFKREDTVEVPCCFPVFIEVPVGNATVEICPGDSTGDSIAFVKSPAASVVFLDRV